jgi:hypothetical protein
MPVSVASLRLTQAAIVTVLLLLAPAADAAPTTLKAALTGAAEVNGGDPDGAGTFTVELDPDTNDFCYALWGEKIGKVTMAHIHKGDAGAEGPVVFGIEVTGKNNDMCIAIDKDKLDPLVENPAGYYVNIHTTDFPGGAVRGQLTK